MNLLIFSNCYATQIKYYLESLSSFRKKFKSIDIISTYMNLNDLSILNNFSTCDYLICNNIKKYKHFTPQNLKKKVKASCKIIVLEFFRFHGFYPIKHIPQENNDLWIIDESFLKTSNYNEYINYKLQADTIKTHFDSSLKELKILSENSDIKIYDFFVLNYKTKLLYRDHYHMSHIFLLYIIKQLLILLNIPVESNIVDNIPEYYTRGFKFRYKPILNCIKNVLGLTFEDNNINFFNKIISKEQFYTVIINNKNSNLKVIENEINKI